MSKDGLFFGGHTHLHASVHHAPIDPNNGDGQTGWKGTNGHISEETSRNDACDMCSCALEVPLPYDRVTAHGRPGQPNDVVSR